MGATGEDPKRSLSRLNSAGRLAADGFKDDEDADGFGVPFDVSARGRDGATSSVGVFGMGFCASFRSEATPLGKGEENADEERSSDGREGCGNGLLKGINIYE